jgi:hypothetical protein
MDVHYVINQALARVSWVFRRIVDQAWAWAWALCCVALHRRPGVGVSVV